MAAQSAHTTLAAELNLAMACNAAAQEAYRSTWGIAWSPLPLNGSTPRSFAPSTVAVTCR